ncbi:hypothetical protein OIV57_17515 [Burkholderia pseudomallei]|uniref:hypothetical protein n=1 Tax=Burkholderia pseudomallei TaxID=28450 RepID=UPI0021F6FD50|nr:hypothetical protein [Burkholderia pseudomallei]MCV9913936.1 hypothetical protein [Burkholderia pseudomallei]MCW0071259.1 hypothetical protein [Burkholderia pseudomallei]
MRDWKEVLKKFSDNRQEELLLKKGLETLSNKQEVKKQEVNIEEVKQEQKRKHTL